ncbi:MAG: ComEA family DNA-binding protein [Pyrinomonadaceae bacterium]
MRAAKSYYFNNCNFILKLLLLIALCILLANCARRESNQVLTIRNPNLISENAVDINTATAEELEKLPHVGEETAKKIIEFRGKYGKFRRTENLILVHGMSDKKFRDLQSLVKVE